MNTLRLTGIAIIVAGLLALAYGGFSYTREDTALKLGPIELTVKDRERINVPVWAGIAAVVAGGLLLLGASRKG
jgi:hypothetical protein